MFLRCAHLIYAALALLAFPAGAGAQESLFTIRNVTVDVTAASAVEAREKAFAQAQQDAFKTMAERLLPEEEMKTFEPPAPDAISAMVNDFEITQEQLSHVRYVGTYTFRFKDDAVRAWLNGRGLSYTDVRSKPVLVLPFYQWGSRTILWGDDNPWLAAWARSETWQGLVPSTVPIGDLQDAADIGDDDSLTYKPENLESMARRYDAGDALVMVAAPQWKGEPAPGAAPDEIAVSIYRTDGPAPQFVDSLKIKSEAGEQPAALFDRAVKDARAFMQKDWKGRTVVRQEEKNDMTVRVRFSSMVEWVETQKTLRRVQGVDGVKLLSLKPGEAQVALAFQGSEDRLRLALAQADMTLTAPQVRFDGWQAQGPLVYDLFLNKFGHSGPH